jgi:hypothetical protein
MVNLNHLFETSQLLYGRTFCLALSNKKKKKKCSKACCLCKTDFMYQSMVLCNRKTKGFLLCAFQSSIFLFFYSRAALYAFHELQNRTSPNFTFLVPHLNSIVLSDYRAALNRPNLVTVVILMSSVNRSCVAPFTDRFISCNPRTARRNKLCSKAA